MELQFKLGVGSNHVHIPVYVNGKGPFNFTLDTGAGATTISKSLAESLGIPMQVNDKMRAVGVGGTVPVMTAKVDSLTIESETFANENVVVIDFDSIFGAGFIPGAIGHSVLKSYRMSLNYSTKIFRLEKRNEGASTEEDRLDWVKFEYIADSHLIGVPVYVNGRGPFDFILDTGSSGTILSPKLAETLGLTQDNLEWQHNDIRAEARGCSEGLCPGVGGVAVGYPVNLERISVGAATQESPTVAVIDLNLVSPLGGKIDHGVLGYPFLKDFELIIDYPNKQFALVDQRAVV